MNDETRREMARIVGRNIAKILVERGMSQSDLAIAMGVSKGAISAWVNGSRFPNPENIAAISKKLNVPQSAIMGIDGQTYISAKYEIPKEERDKLRQAILDILNSENIEANETIKIVSDKIKQNKLYDELFRASASVPTEDIEIVTQMVKKWSNGSH